MHDSSSIHVTHAGPVSLGGGESRRPEVLREAAAQFESLFMQMMLKSMRAASLGSGILDSKQSDTYRDMFDQEIAKDLSRGRGLGIADMLIRQFGGDPEKHGPSATAESVRAPAVLPTARRKAADALAPQAPALAAPRTPLEFVREAWPHAREAAQRLGVSARAVLAQAALETGWGQRTLPRGDGGSSFNLFGIKAGRGWRGDTVGLPTIEYRDGLPRREHAQFRAYDSLADAFADYATLLAGNPRYEGVLAKGEDIVGFAEALQNAGYATDPEYARKIESIADSATLRDALAGLKFSGTRP